MSVRSVLCLLLICGLYGQDKKPEKQMMVIFEYHVNPAKVAQYEASIKEGMALLSENHLAWPAIRALQKDNFVYSYAVDIDSLTHLEDLYGLYGALSVKLGQNPFEKSMAYIESMKQYSVMRHEAFSYWPEKSELKMEDVGFIGFSFYSFPIRNNKAALELAAKYKQLHKDKGITRGYSMYTAGIGASGPSIAIAVAAKNAADFYQSQERQMGILGAEGAALNQEALELCSGITHSHGWTRPDLSYIPTKKTD